MTGYIQTRLYAVITAAGLTPWTGTDSGVPQSGAQGLAYFMAAVLNTAIGYQALHLPDPQDTPRHARQQVTKAWAQD